MNREIILFGAGKIGKEAAMFFGLRNIECFVDSNKAGGMYLGKYILSLDDFLELKGDYRVIVSVGKEYFDEVASTLVSEHVPFESYQTLYQEYLNQSRGNPKIEKLRNLYKGQRVCLVGNGPSLRTDDLESLSEHGVLTFCCNFINKIFSQTEWRPDFYCSTEASAIALNKDFIQNFPLKAKFIRDYSGDDQYPDARLSKIPKDVALFQMTSELDYSVDASKKVVEHETVMTCMLHLAMYMGFSEIYLLGVDNTLTPSVHTSNTEELHPHFYDEDKEENEKRKAIMPSVWYDNDFEYAIKKVNAAYEAARVYAEAQGITIYNTTRGGKLEVFERVDMDKMFQKSKVI